MVFPVANGTRAGSVFLRRIRSREGLARFRCNGRRVGSGPPDEPRKACPTWPANSGRHVGGRRARGNLYIVIWAAHFYRLTPTISLFAARTRRAPTADMRRRRGSTASSRVPTSATARSWLPSRFGRSETEWAGLPDSAASVGNDTRRHCCCETRPKPADWRSTDHQQQQSQRAAFLGAGGRIGKVMGSVISAASAETDMIPAQLRYGWGWRSTKHPGTTRIIGREFHGHGRVEWQFTGVGNFQAPQAAGTSDRSCATPIRAH